LKNTTYAKIALCAAALQLPACVIVDDDRGLGTLTVEWTIDGVRNPADCAAFGVDRLELVLFTRSGRVVDEIEPLCESFGVSIDLVEGLYFGDATLVDGFDDPATLTQPIDNIDIIAATELAVDIDFPIGSFL
jgi:hypothetical protein